jgi:hypothetical protein
MVKPGSQRVRERLMGACIRAGAVTAIAAALVMIGMCSSSLAQLRPRADARNAVRDYMQGKPLPGLPDLKKPVYVKPGSWLCSTPGTLANPNKDVLVAMHACFVAPVAARVMVYPPSTDQRYVEAYVYQIIEVGVIPAQISNGRPQYGWTELSNLRN